MTDTYTYKTIPEGRASDTKTEGGMSRIPALKYGVKTVSWLRHLVCGIPALKYGVKTVSWLRHSLAFFLTYSLLLGFLASCSSDEIKKVSEKEEGKISVSFMLPHAQGFETRSMEIDEEGWMSNLYIVAVQVNNTDNDRMLIYSVDPTGYDTQVGDTNYDKYKINLYPGNYRFYVLANLDLYLTRQNKISNFSTEDEIRKIVLNYRAETPLIPAHLPMACLPENISTRPDGTGVGSNLITIAENNSTQIYANMSFLCSKVRYTIMFDKTNNGISKQFGDQWIRFFVDENDKPLVTNLRKQTELIKNAGGTIDTNSRFITISTSTDNTEADTPSEVDAHTSASSQINLYSWSLEIDRYKWHTDGADYPKKASDQLDVWDGNLDDWKKQEQKMWQGVVYLPENDDDGIDKTILYFPYYNYLIENGVVINEERGEEPKEIILFSNDTGYTHYPDNNGNSIYDESSTNDKSHGLKRGYMYDVVAKVVNPDDPTLYIQVYLL